MGRAWRWHGDDTAAVNPFADRFAGPLQSDCEAIATLALACLGISEVSPNRGPEVDRIVELGGGQPDRAAPWCAYFVSAVLSEAVRRGIDVPHKIRTGRAVRHWTGAETAHQIDRADIWCLPPPLVCGLIFVRTRTSKSVRQRELVLAGAQRVAGHTGITVGLSQERGILCVAGNSSGAGHSYARGSGAVALEHYDQSGRGYARIVGFIDPIGEASAYIRDVKGLARWVLQN